ncbi:hypothetical protein [Liquorilactobacillus ghanensis]|uniref:hypothetical protein n=1 Tax=Liquorilactobacillus ghanensis TaxID=399370 RepID=UPI0039ECDE89
MKTTKLVVGILMIVLSVYIVFQSMLAGFGDALTNSGGTSEGSGLIFAILFLASGIVYIVNKSKTSLGSDIACMVMLLIAWLIGITMSGIYGDLIVWSWLAFIIGVGFFVWHLISNKKNPASDESSTSYKDSQNQKNNKPFYKKWWVWVLAVVVIIFLIGVFGGTGNSKSNNNTKQNSTENASGHSTTNKEKGNTTSPQKITVSYQNYSISHSKTYLTNYENTMWNAATVKVAKIVVYTLKNPTKYKSANDGTFQATGFVRIYFNVKANRDISIYPTQGTYIFNNTEQHEADAGETWDGDISNGVTKNGSVTVPIKDVSNLKTVRIKFDGNYNTNDYDDNNSDHTYDFTLNL